MMVRLGLVSPKIFFLGHSFTEETDSFSVLLSLESAAALVLGKG